MQEEGTIDGICLGYISYFFFKSLHHYWLDSFRWLIVQDKYAMESFGGRCTGDYSPASLGFFDRLLFLILYLILFLREVELQYWRFESSNNPLRHFNQH